MTNGVGKLIEKLADAYPDVRAAAEDCVKALQAYGTTTSLLCIFTLSSFSRRLSDQICYIDQGREIEQLRPDNPVNERLVQQKTVLYTLLW